MTSSRTWSHGPSPGQYQSPDQARHHVPGGGGGGGGGVPVNRLELLPIKVKSILKSEPNPPSYSKNYNGGNRPDDLMECSVLNIF